MNDLVVSSILSKKRFVYVQCENGDGTIQDGIESTQDRSENDGSEEADEKVGHDITYQCGVYEIGILEIIGTIEVKGDDSRECDVEDVQNFEERSQHDALLTLFKALGPECPLDYKLVSCPEEEVVNEHPCEEY